MTHAVGVREGVIPDSKSISIIDPTSSENATFCYTTIPVTLTNIHAGIQGSTNVTMLVVFGPDRSGTGSTNACASTAVSNTTTGADISVTNASVPASNYIWMTTSALTGTPTELNVTISYQ